MVLASPRASPEAPISVLPHHAPMRRVLVLSALVTTVASLSYYKPVNTPATRIRLFGPLKVANRSECQLACDCARENSYNCSSYTLPIPPSNCTAYFYEDGGCALLGESFHNKCTRNNTEYVLIPDPCGNVSCGKGTCVVTGELEPKCECDVGYVGEKCDEPVPTTTIATSTELMTTTIPATCPTGGVWSEWEATVPCPTTCGSCSEVSRKRTCMKTCGDCPCSGPDTDVGPCGMTLCPFTDKNSKTCCTGYSRKWNERLPVFNVCGKTEIGPIKCAGS